MFKIKALVNGRETVVTVKDAYMSGVCKNIKMHEGTMIFRGQETAVVVAESEVLEVIREESKKEFKLKGSVKKFETAIAHAAKEIVKENPEHDFDWSVSELLSKDEWVALIEQLKKLDKNGFDKALEICVEGNEDLQEDGEHEESKEFWMVTDKIDKVIEAMIENRGI